MLKCGVWGHRINPAWGNILMYICIFKQVQYRDYWIHMIYMNVALYIVVLTIIPSYIALANQCMHTEVSSKYTRVCVTNLCTMINNAMHLREEAKNIKYKEQYRWLGVDFKPLIMEMHGAIFIKMLASAAADRHDRPCCIVFSYWQRRISTVLQKFNARILYLAHCKIDGTSPCDGLEFANEFKEIMFEEARFYGSSMFVYTIYHTSH